MTTSIGRGIAREIHSALLDFSGGVVGGINEYHGRVRHVRLADNVFMRPAGAMRIRGGSQRLSSAVLPREPHTLGEWLSASGSNRLFVMTKEAGSGFMYEAGASSFTAQTLPYSHSDKIMSFEQLNDALWGTQVGGALAPIFYRSSNPANTWHSMTLPKPAVAVTFGADQAGGALSTSATYYYRVRWRFSDGSSLAGPVSTGETVLAGFQTIRISGNLVPGSPRSDYLGWTLERTKEGGTSAGPFYLVADGTATTYDDGAADGSLFEMTDETLHAEPPHMEGLIAHKDRLFGWTGSTLYASQAIGDEEATGLCNWPGLQGYNFGKDDGDAIQKVERHQDRLIVVKRQSVWALEGDDPGSFRVVPIVSGVGASGPRAVTSHGGRVWMFGSSGSAGPANGFHVLTGNTVKPWGWLEVGHYVDTFTNALLSDVELIQYLGQYVISSYSRGGSYNDEQVVYDQRFDNWTHFTNWRMKGALVQRGSQFGGATLIWCDPRNWPAFTKAGITAGMTVTGAGIPAATTVVSVGGDGTTFVLSNPATATAGPVTLTFGGSITVATCYTTNLSTSVLSKDWRLWQGFRGFKDEKASDGSGGDPVAFAVETPWMDDGMPSVFKDWNRIQAYAFGDNESLNVALSFDPPAPTASASLRVLNSGLTWGAFTWGAGAWAQPDEATATTGLTAGSIARRWRARVTGSISGDMLFKGLVLDGKLERERKHSGVSP